MSEGIPENKISVTGNTIVDAVYQNLDIVKEKGITCDGLGVEPHNYFLVTIHRQENIDNKGRFQGILKGLEMIHKEFDFPVLYPVHPRARKRMKEFRLKPEGVKMMTPLDYLSFLHIESNANLVLTDSGGVQEES